MEDSLMLGAECAEDVERLRADPAVAKMLGDTPSSTRAMRGWLEKCHDAQVVAQARREALELDLRASVPEVTAELRGLQPVVAIWGETRVALATEFRDGNVPAGKDPQPGTTGLAR